MTLAGEPIDAGARAWLSRESELVEMTASTATDGDRGYEWSGTVIRYFWSQGHGLVQPNAAASRPAALRWEWKFSDIALGHNETSNDTYGSRNEADEAFIAYGNGYYIDAVTGSDSDGSLTVHFDVRLALDVEAFVVLWERLSRDLPLDSDSRRVGDSLALMAAEVVKGDKIPRSVLRSTFEWFSQRFDEFSQEAGRSAGSVVGKGLGAGLVLGASAGGAAATGTLPRLIEATSRILGQLS